MQFLIQPICFTEKPFGSAHIGEHGRRVFVKRFIRTLRATLDFSDQLSSIVARQVLLLEFPANLLPIGPGIPIIRVSQQCLAPEQLKQPHQ